MKIVINLFEYSCLVLPKKAFGCRSSITAILLLSLIFYSCSGKPQTFNAPSKVLIIGIDGASWDILDSLVKNGRTPAIKSLIENGVKASFKTQQPTLSPAIWTTISTGKSPQKHGIFGFDGVPGQTMTTLPTTQMRKAKAMWNIVSDSKKTAGMVSWWVTWPAETINGFIVSDRVAYTRMEASIKNEKISPYDTYPKNLFNEIKHFIKKPNDISNSEIKRFMNLNDELIEKYMRNASYKMGNFLPEFKYVFQSDKSSFNIGEYLLEKEAPDLFGIFFAGVDTVSHLYWHFMEPQHFEKHKINKSHISKFSNVIKEYYIFIDELIGKLLEKADENYTVIIISDHGFGPTGNLPWSGGHGKITPGAPVAPDGIFVMKGNQIKKGVTIKNATVLDILPTTLHLLGLPVARDMEGKVLIEAFENKFLKNNPVKYIRTYEKEGNKQKKDVLISDPKRDKDVLEKLRSLGYLQ